MGRLPVGGGKVAAYDLHYAVGVLMLVLALGRGAWRLLAPGSTMRTSPDGRAPPRTSATMCSTSACWACRCRAGR
jgi:cytochrome b561